MALPTFQPIHEIVEAYATEFVRREWSPPVFGRTKAFQTFGLPRYDGSPLRYFRRVDRALRCALVSLYRIVLAQERSPEWTQPWRGGTWAVGTLIKNPACVPHHLDKRGDGLIGRVMWHPNAPACVGCGAS